MDALLSRLQAESPGAMTVRKQTGPSELAPSWFVDPLDTSASPLWIIGASWSDATVGFGRSSGRIELWQMGKTTAAEAADHLGQICQGVIAGGLTEWRQDERACRYELRLPSGEVYSGRSNTLLRRRWKAVERLSPYAL